MKTFFSNEQGEKAGQDGKGGNDGHLKTEAKGTLTKTPGRLKSKIPIIKMQMV